MPSLHCGLPTLDAAGAAAARAAARPARRRPAAAARRRPAAAAAPVVPPFPAVPAVPRPTSRRCRSCRRSACAGARRAGGPGDARRRYWSRNPPPPAARRRTCERKKSMSLDVEPFFGERGPLYRSVDGKIKERSAGSSPSRRSCRSGTSSGRCRTASARDVAGRAGVGRAAVGRAVGGQRLLADAVVAVPARGHALGDLRAGRALRRDRRSPSRCTSATSRIGVDAPGTAQQPKQSQPFGTSFWHLSTQVCDCDDDTEHSVAC